jgi:hypothetical protein
MAACEKDSLLPSLSVVVIDASAPGREGTLPALLAVRGVCDTLFDPNFALSHCAFVVLLLLLLLHCPVPLFGDSCFLTEDRLLRFSDFDDTVDADSEVDSTDDGDEEDARGAERMISQLLLLLVLPSCLTVTCESGLNSTVASGAECADAPALP